jgi:hypothetical protein
MTTADTGWTARLSRGLTACAAALMLGLGVGVGAAGSALAQGPAPAERPRNLLVEVRQGSSFSDQSTTAGAGIGGTRIGGQVVIGGGSGGFGTFGGVGITFGGAQQRSTASDAVSTQIRVLDGGRATVQSASSQPIVLLTRVGPNLVPGAVFINAGSSIVLQPRLTAPAPPPTPAPAAAGGTPTAAPPPWVEVALSAQQSQFNPNVPGAVNTQGASTTLELPLGEWVTVAEQADQAEASRSTVGGAVAPAGASNSGVGVEQRSRNARFVVQIRITVAN